MTTTAMVKLATSVGVSEEEITDVVKGMIVSAKGQHGSLATNAELTVVSGICAQYDLNPLTREAHAFISGGKLSVVIGIDGWLKIMNRQPNFNGIEYEYEFDGKELVSITTKIHIKGRDFPTCVTEYMDECYQPRSPAWQKFKKRMLRNKSTGQCIRVAFGISEVIDDDEASRIKSNSPEKDITPQVSVDFTAVEELMAECADLKTLDEVCKSIRDDIQVRGSWERSKSQLIALKVKHKDRINADYLEPKKEAEPEAEASIEGELLAGDDEDIGFSDEVDEFGDVK